MNWLKAMVDGWEKSIQESKSNTQISIGGSNITQSGGKGGTSVQTSNGLTVINKNGNVEIKGNLKSLKVNGKEIDLGL